MKSIRLQREQLKSNFDSGKSKKLRALNHTGFRRPLTLGDERPSLRLNHSLGASHNSLSYPLQAKLTVNQPGDQYEQEADRVAEQVMRMPDPALRLQRKCGCAGSEGACQCNSQQPLVQRRAISTEGTLAATAPPIVDDVMRSPGQQLDQSTRTFFEQRFRQDFSRVRVHTDAVADQSARAVNAIAYTVGHNVAFGAGRYEPHTNAGRQLLAHELTHVVQQLGSQPETPDHLADIQSDPGKHKAGSAAVGPSNPRGSRGSEVVQSSYQLQRSCADGDCRTCAGGTRDFWVTVFFRRRATADTMTKLRAQINGAKAILANCCLNLKFDFNWTLLRGGGSLPAFQGDPAGAWSYTADEQALGTGTTFSGARGIPMLLVDDVPLSGGGITIDPRFDTTYTGRRYFAIAINQTSTPNPNCNHIAHELWHVGSGLSAHDPANGTLTSCTGAGVSLAYCNALRNMVAPVGDFPLPAPARGAGATRLA